MLDACSMAECRCNHDPDGHDISAWESTCERLQTKSRKSGEQMRLSSPCSSDDEANRARDSQSMTPDDGQKPRRHARKQNANLQGDSDHAASTSTRSEPTPTMETHSLVSAATMIEAAARGMIARADMRRVSEDILNAIHGMEADSMQQAIHHMKMVSSPNSSARALCCYILMSTTRRLTDRDARSGSTPLHIAASRRHVR
jgi:hypothetical protein